jgi:hypothetical protein
VLDRHNFRVTGLRPPGSPLLHIDQTDLNQTGRPVMVSAEWHLPDMFELRINRRSSPLFCPSPVDLGRMAAGSPGLSGHSS